MTESQDEGKDTVSTLEAIVRQLVALRSGIAADDQLVQLLRMVDSATWSAPLPMTVLLDGTLLRGSLVPAEVSAAYLDDTLAKAAHAAVAQLKPVADDSSPTGKEAPEGNARAELVLRQAQAFVKRIGRRPFSAAQARIRRRNASALVTLNRWHQSPDHESGHTPFDIPGDFTDLRSPARDVIPYMTSQRTLTLTDVLMLVSGEWLSIASPVRVAVGRISAWTVDKV